jgi:hypothetical protein
MGLYCDACGTRGCRHCGPYRTPDRPPDPPACRRFALTALSCNMTLVAGLFLVGLLLFSLGRLLAPKTRTVTRVERVEHCATPLRRDERACQRLCEHGQRTVLKFKSGVHDYTCECY